MNQNIMQTPKHIEIGTWVWMSVTGFMEAYFRERTILVNKFFFTTLWIFQLLSWVFMKRPHFINTSIELTH